jgi:hypothetical protein
MPGLIGGSCKQLQSSCACRQLCSLRGSPGAALPPSGRPSPPCAAARTLASYFCSCRISGAMYRGEPHSVSASPCGSSAFANPKSAILSSGRPLVSLSSRFWGLRSRCVGGVGGRGRWGCEGAGLGGRCGKRAAGRPAASMRQPAPCGPAAGMLQHTVQPACRPAHRGTHMYDIVPPQLPQPRGQLGGQVARGGLADAAVAADVGPQIATRAVFQHQIDAVALLRGGAGEVGRQAAR